MQSHKLARLLLSLPDLPMATRANGHVYSSHDDGYSHGPLMVGRWERGATPHLVIGNMIGYGLDAEACLKEVYFAGEGREESDGNDS